MKWPAPSSSPSTLTSPVTTDPLTFAGALTFSKDITLDTTGSTSGAPRKLAFSQVAGASRSWQIAEVSVGGSIFNAIQGGYGSRVEIASYYGLNLRGSAQTTVSNLATGAATDPGVSVLNTVAAVKGFVVKGAASQSVNFFEVQDSSANPLAFVNSSGTLTSNGQVDAFSSDATKRVVVGYDPTAGGNTGPGITFGTALDTGMVRIAAGVIRTSKFRWLSANEQTTVGAAGGASALPATPTEYLRVQKSDGTELVIPAYAQA